MRMLILSCNAGGGHKSCAAAIQACFGEKGVRCEAADALRFLSKAASRMLSVGHVFMYRHVPGLFRHGYRLLDGKRAVGKRSLLARCLGMGAGRLARFLADGGYDGVICTHVFAAVMLTEALRRHPLPLHTAFVATDYTCSPGVNESELELYFIPDASLAAEFEACGIPAQRLVPSGIPVHGAFYRRSDRSTAGAAFGVPEGHSHMLMMCGSMGCGPMQQLAAELARLLTPRQHLTMLCGTNKRLFRRMQALYAGRENIHIYDYVEDLSLLMEGVDLYLTKPGGLSTTEASVKCLPMVLVDAVAGCEAHNLRYFLNTGLGVTADTPRLLSEKCAELLSEPERILEMRRAGERHRPAVAAERVCGRMLELCGAADSSGPF